MKLYENIKIRRQALKLSQEELAQKLGYKSTSTIAKIEAGKIDLPQSKIKAFADALETTPSALMGWDEEMEEYKAGKTDEELEKTSGDILSYIYNSLSEKGQKKFLDYLNDLQNNPENIDPNTFVRDIFLDNLNDEALRRRKALAKELRIQNKLEKALIKKELKRRKNAPVKE